MAICNVYTYPLTGNIDDLDAHSHVIELNPVDCTPTCLSGILSNCDDLWNCQDQVSSNNYFNPIIAGDKFMFQTKFIDRFNPDPETPATGWTAGGAGFVTAELLNPDGTVASTDHTLFASRYLVGWSGSESYQVIEIDFDLLRSNFPALSCWSFKFIAYDSGASEIDSVCSEHFEEFTDSSCKDTLLIKSTGTADCCSNYYGDPDQYVGNANFIYDNEWRFHASIRQVNTEFEKTSFGTRRSRLELDKLFTLQLKRKIPPYLFNYLAEILLAGQKVFIGGEEYYIDSFSFENESDRKMFIGQIPLFQSCDQNYNC